MKESDVGGTVPTELGINPVSVTVMAATRTTTMGVEDDNDDDDDDGEDVRRSQWWVGEKRTSPAARLTRLWGAKHTHTQLSGIYLKRKLCVHFSG